MKIRIENFGPIHSFEMDLEKDMHILYGENSVGKSYAVMLVYLVLKCLRDSSFPASNGFFRNDDDTVRSILELALEREYASHDYEADVQHIVSSELGRLFEEQFLPRFSASIENSLGGMEFLSNRYSKGACGVEISFTGGTIKMALEEGRKMVIKELQLHRRHILVGSKSERLSSNQEAVFTVNNDRSSKFWQERPNAVGKVGKFQPQKYYVRPVFELGDKIKFFFDQLYFLPASRSGLFLGMQSFAPMLAKLAQMRHLVKEKIEIPGLSDPMADYFLMLSSITPSANESSFTFLAKRMEEEILRGEVYFDGARKTLVVKDSKIDIHFDLSRVSSMISEIASLIAVIKYVIHEDYEEGEDIPAVLFIEEPEAHLHPKIQIKLMEFFAELTKLGVKVIMTTHSDFLFNKASNMILKGELDDQKVANYHIIMTEKGSIVNPKVTLHEWGLDDENFVGVAEELLNERMIAVELLNENEPH